MGPFTFVIKGIEGFLAGWILKSRDGNQGNIRMVFAWIIGGIEMVTGYFLVQVYMYGFGAALVEIPFNFFQMLIGGIIGIPIAKTLKQRLKT